MECNIMKKQNTIYHVQNMSLINTHLIPTIIHKQWLSKTDDKLGLNRLEMLGVSTTRSLDWAKEFKKRHNLSIVYELDKDAIQNNFKIKPISWNADLKSNNHKHEFEEFIVFNKGNKGRSKDTLSVLHSALVKMEESYLLRHAAHFLTSYDNRYPDVISDSIVQFVSRNGLNQRDRNKDWTIDNFHKDKKSFDNLVKANPNIHLYNSSMHLLDIKLAKQYLPEKFINIDELYQINKLHLEELDSSVISPIFNEAKQNASSQLFFLSGFTYLNTLEIEFKINEYLKHNPKYLIKNITPLLFDPYELSSMSYKDIFNYIKDNKSNIAQNILEWNDDLYSFKNMLLGISDNFSVEAEKIQSKLLDMRSDFHENNKRGLEIEKYIVAYHFDEIGLFVKHLVDSNVKVEISDKKEFDLFIKSQFNDFSQTVLKKTVCDDNKEIENKLSHVFHIDGLKKNPIGLFGIAGELSDFDIYKQIKLIDSNKIKLLNENKRELDIDKSHDHIIKAKYGM